MCELFHLTGYCAFRRVPAVDQRLCLELNPLRLEHVVRGLLFGEVFGKPCVCGFSQAVVVPIAVSWLSSPDGVGDDFFVKEAGSL